MIKHRDRILMALNHEEPDRCPMHILFTPDFAERLKTFLVNEGKDIGEIDYGVLGGRYPYNIDRILESDMLITTVGWLHSFNHPQERYVDEWGVEWKAVYFDTPYGQGRYTDIVKNPIITEADIENYNSPDPNRPSLYEEALCVINDFKSDYWIVGSVAGGIFESACGLHGYENMLIDIALNPDIAERIMQITYKYHLEAAKRFVKMGVDMLWLGEDVGAQKNMLISPDLWRKLLKPKMANMISEVRIINPGIRIAYHSDGYIVPIIPELIEIGVDVLNPIQPGAMDPYQLKKQFGDNLTFWGSVDQQHTLPHGTIQEVKNEVLERLRIMGKGGGFIIAPAHRVQMDTPMENFWSMYDTITNTHYSSST
jgi:uroporphyrinogen decarboxylase